MNYPISAAGRSLFRGFGMSAMANVPGSGPLVLIGCEDARTVAYLTELLESWDFNVEVAERGSLALLRLEEPNSPGIALLDMDLSGTSGGGIVWQGRRRPDAPR